MLGYSRSPSVSAKRLQNLEYNTNLYGWAAYHAGGVFDRMRLSDPKVDGLRSAMNLPLIGAGVRIEPADPDDERAKEIAEFVQRALISDGNFGMQHPWRAFVTEALLYLDYGFAPFEMVWAMQEGKAVIRRFAYRPPSTLWDGIDVQDGRVVKATQASVNGGPFEISGDKLVWFVHRREGDNWLGRPLLRSMYKPWFNKETAEVLLLINIEKGGGVPYAQQGDIASFNTEQLAAIDDALEKFHVSERAYLRMPAGIEVSMLTGNASVSEALAFLRYCDEQLSNVAIAQVLDLGKTETGSRALGRTMSDMFVDSLTSIATNIEDTMNAAGGPIAQLVDFNFADGADYMPHLRFGSLSKLDLKTLAVGLYQCYQMGMAFGDEDWEWIRSELDLPAMKAQDESAPAPPKPTLETEPTPSPTDPAATGDEDEPGIGDGVGLAEGGYRRELTELESYVALDELSASLDDAKNIIRTRTQGVRDRIVNALSKRAFEAVESGSAERVAALASVKAPNVDALAAELQIIFGEYFDAGRRQVADELERQQAGQPVLDRITGQRHGEVVTAADVRPMTTKEARRFYEALATKGEVAARAIASVAVTSAAERASAALTTATTLEAIQQAVARASDEAALKVGWTVTQVVIDGRSAQAEEEREKIASATYSAILDGGTCSACEPRDGDMTEDIEEASGWTPNPDCEGGEKCRCIVIYEYKAGE